MQNSGIQVLFMGTNFYRLIEGLLVTVRIAVMAMGLSIVLGILFGIIMNSRTKWVVTVSRLYLEVVRFMPQVVLLFLVYFGVAKHFGINLTGELSAVIVFTFWGTAEMGDLVRSALISISNHQYEAGSALGMTSGQVYRYIIVPQTIRRLIPSIMNLLTRMIKTTSLVVMIGVVEVVKVGKQMIDAARFDAPSAAFWIYGVIFLLYFAICFPFSRASAVIERKLRD